VHTYEVDYNNRIKVSAIFNFMQEVAIEHARLLHSTYEELMDRGLYWVLVRARLELTGIPMINDKVRLETWLKGKNKLYYQREYLIYNAQNKIIGQATTDWVIINATTKHLQRKNIFEEESKYYLDKQAVKQSLFKIEDISIKELAYFREVRYSELDINCHVNNTRYIDWIMDAFDQNFHTNKNLKSLQVNYKHQSKWGEKVKILKGQTKTDNFYVEGITEESGYKVFEAIVEWECAHS